MADRPWREAWRERLHGAWGLTRVCWRSDPLASAVTLVTVVGAQVTVPFAAVAMKWLTNAIVARSPRDAVAAVVLFGALSAQGLVASLVGFPVQMRLREKATHAINVELMTIVGGVPTLEHVERPEYADKVEVLRATRRTLAALPDALMSYVSSIAQMVVTVGVLTHSQPAMILLPFFGLPAVWASRRSAKAQERLQDDRAELTRTRAHLFRLATSPAAGKELRIFGLGPTILRRRDDLWKRFDRDTVSLSLSRQALASAAWMVFAVGYFGAIALVIRDAVRGRGTPGDVVLAVTLAAQIRGQVASLFGMASSITSIVASTDRYWWLVTFARRAAASVRPASPVAVPADLSEGIVLEDVGFRYPGTDADVLKGVNVRVPAGSTVAIVGDNGAGKSTLVKLMARFYDPSSGRILVDGHDLRDFDIAEWRSRLSAGFQDFVRFELAARQVVGVGDLPRLDDDPSVREALGRAASSELESDLPGGLGTLVGRSFEGGVELSGGQWQKLALGRAMMRDDPLLLLLDEPTASLDAQTEHALFERYAGAARRAAVSNGGITILVSHRFSTVRMADLILVVDGATVREQGSHAELIGLEGLYAELYELQARAYR